MKLLKHLFVCLVLFFVLPALAYSGSKSPFDIKMPFKNLAIEYTHSGMTTGTEQYYIRKYGKETASYKKITTTVMGMKTVEETVEIQDPDWIYRFDLREKTGQKTVNPMKYMKEEYKKLSAAEKKEVDKNGKSLGASFSGQSGGNVEEKAAKILGYDCDKISIMGTTVYTIHDAGVPLKTDSNIMGMQSKSVATSVKKGGAKRKFFKFPKGIVPVEDPESDAMARQMAKQTIAMLKDPDAAKKSGSPMMSRPPKRKKTGGSQPPSDEEMQKVMEMMKQMMGNQ